MVNTFDKSDVEFVRRIACLFPSLRCLSLLFTSLTPNAFRLFRTSIAPNLRHVILDNSVPLTGYSWTELMDSLSAVEELKLVIYRSERFDALCVQRVPKSLVYFHVKIVDYSSNKNTRLLADIVNSLGDSEANDLQYLRLETDQKHVTDELEHVQHVAKLSKLISLSVPIYPLFSHHSWRQSLKIYSKLNNLEFLEYLILELMTENIQTFLNSLLKNFKQARFARALKRLRLVNFNLTQETCEIIANIFVNLIGLDLIDCSHAQTDLSKLTNLESISIEYPSSVYCDQQCEHSSFASSEIEKIILQCSNLKCINLVNIKDLKADERIREFKSQFSSETNIKVFISV